MYIQQLKQKASLKNKTLVLPESADERTIKAAQIIINEKIAAKVILPDFKGLVKLNHPRIEILNAPGFIKEKDLTQKLYELRKHKGITEEEAAKLIENELYFGAMLLRENHGDCMVAGAVNATSDVIRSVLHVIGLKENVNCISSHFFMYIKDSRYGEDGKFVYADCGVVPDPSAKQLCSIAYMAALSASEIYGMAPKVAFLSFSTKGSAKHRTLDKVIEASRIFKEKYPHIPSDGELQGDSAIVPSVSESKIKGDNVLKGEANVLVFPDLNSGNIAYKLTQRLAGAVALGPIIQGAARPVNDLSRGASVDDIVNVSAITVCQCP